MNTDNKKFVRRAYGKSELALMYFPYSTPHCAVNHLMSWLNRCQPLSEQLMATGYTKSAKYFTPRQVEIIVGFIGEP